MKILLLSALAAFATSAVAQMHLEMAEELSDGLQAQLMAGQTTVDGVSLNQYGGTTATTYLIFGDEDTPYAAKAKSSPFVTTLLKMAYGWDPSAAMGTTGPTAAQYYDAIRGSKAGFQYIVDFTTIKPGDLLASKYLNDTTNTGHMMVVTGVVAGPNDGKKKNWYVEVIDASSAKHSNDSRIFGGTSWQGVGRGVIRVETLNKRITGWAWSMGGSLYLPDYRPIVLGHALFAG